MAPLASPLHHAPTSPHPSEPADTPRARHPGHVKSASISAGSGGSGAAREAPASASADSRGDASRWLEDRLLICLNQRNNICFC